MRRLEVARTQLTGRRRCENYAHRPARLCLAEIIITNGTDKPAAVRLATEVLAQDTASVIAATIKERAHTALGHREASAAWSRGPPQRRSATSSTPATTSSATTRR